MITPPHNQCKKVLIFYIAFFYPPLRHVPHPPSLYELPKIPFLRRTQVWFLPDLNRASLVTVFGAQFNGFQRVCDALVHLNHQYCIVYAICSDITL